MGSALCKVFVDSRYVSSRLISPNSDELQKDESHCRVCAACHTGKEIEVVFVRHGESQWNAAQKNWALWDMAKRNDHPLSSTGRQQCEDLRYKIQDADDFPPIEVIFSSPLTRAIETAILVLPNHLRGRVRGQTEPVSLVLMPEAREKLNLGGRDSVSDSRGQEIVNGAFEDLNLLYDSVSDAESVGFSSPQTRTSSMTRSTEATMDDAMCSDGEENSYKKTDIIEDSRESCSTDKNDEDGRWNLSRRVSSGQHKRASILKDRDMCRIDINKVQQEWCTGTAAIGEALPMFRARLDDFMHQLMHSNYKSMCVVGHSHFIRMVFREYLAEQVCAEEKGLCDLLKQYVMPNCGVVQCTIRCHEHGRLSISRVKMLCGTRITPPKPKKRFRCTAFTSCCSATDPSFPRLDKDELCVDAQRDDPCATRDADTRAKESSVGFSAPGESAPRPKGNRDSVPTLSPTDSLIFNADSSCSGLRMGESFPGHLDMNAQPEPLRRSMRSSVKSMPDVPEDATVPSAHNTKASVLREATKSSNGTKHKIVNDASLVADSEKNPPSCR